LRQPIIHRPVQVVCDLRDLAGGNQRGDCNETPILSFRAYGPRKLMKIT
jgi:hypothetical protein